MQRILRTILVLVAVTFIGYGAWAQQAGTVLVRGDVLKPGSWSPQDIKQRFADQIQQVKFTTKNQEQHVGTGIPLLALLQEAAPKTESVPKHYDMTFLVIIEAHDGYRAFFSLAELLPSVGNAQAYLIWEEDGKPLPVNQAPFRMIVSSDRGHDRSIYAIASITLVDGTKLANQLAAGPRP